jgi:hypothetical protein
MPCTFSDHHVRLELLEIDKEAMLCFNFNYLPKELMPNESLSTEQETYVAFNHNMFCSPNLNCGYDCICLFHTLRMLDLLRAWSSS